VPPADADAPLLDEAVLTELLTSTGDDQTFVRDLLDTYLAETPEQLEAIGAALDQDDAAALVRPAHTLKSSSATLGAMQLSALGRELEMMGRTGALDPTARTTRDAANEAWQATSEAIQSWLAARSA
jgi:HPt (histidine-containing phosphotransfer) domain-containing protein